MLLFPVFSQRAADTLGTTPWPSLGLGFALLAGVPVAALLVFGIGLLIGGWWLGPLMLAFYFGLLPVAYATVGLFLGRFIVRRAGRPDVENVWNLLAALVFLGLVSLVPFAGGLVLFTAVLFGLGACILALNATYRGRPATPDRLVAAPNHTPERHTSPVPVS